MARQKREFTEEEINTIKTMYNEGKSVLGIATQLHTTNRVINSIINKYGIKRPTKSTPSSKATLYRKREAIRKTIDKLLEELDYCRYKQHNTTGMEQAQWKAKRTEVRKQIQALQREGLETYINEEAENKLIEISNIECTSVDDILKQVEITVARQFASKII